MQMGQGWVLGSYCALSVVCAACSSNSSDASTGGSGSGGDANGGNGGSLALAGAGGSSSAGTSSANRGGSSGSASAGAGGSAAPCVGACTVDLAAGLASPTALAVDANYVYVLLGSNATVQRIPLAGGNPETIASVELGVPGLDGLAVDATSVYFTVESGGAHTGVMKAPLAGGPVENLAPDTAKPQMLRINASMAFFVGDSIVSGVPLAGGPVVTLVSEGDKGSPQRIALDQSYAYFTDDSPFNYTIKRSLLGGDGTLTLGMNEPEMSDVAVDSARGVFYLSSGDLKKIGVGSPDVLAPGLTGTGDYMLLDGDTIYATNDTQGSIVKVAKTGGTPTTVATGQSMFMQSLTADATTLYWIDRGDALGTSGVVRKTAK